MTDFDPADHTIQEVRDYLADHPDETAAVRAAEEARGDEARTTLLNSLSAQAADDDVDETAEGDEAEQNLDPVTGLPVGEGFPPGEYPESNTFGYAEADTETE